MKKLQLMHMGLSAFFMMTIDKNKTAGIAKDKCIKAMQYLASD